MEISFETELIRDTGVISLIVEGSYTPGTAARTWGHPDRMHAGDPGEAIITRVRLAGTGGGCVIAMLTEAEGRELTEQLAAEGAETERSAAEARAESYADDYGDDDYCMLSDEVAL